MMLFNLLPEDFLIFYSSYFINNFVIIYSRLYRTDIRLPLC
nr:MAG TPA: hypothetical protein [Caudoviricetes sp.]